MPTGYALPSELQTAISNVIGSWLLAIGSWLLAIGVIGAIRAIGVIGAIGVLVTLANS